MTKVARRKFYTPWLYISRATITTEEGDYPSLKYADAIVRIAKESSLNGLQDQLCRHKRGELPKVLQMRLCRLFKIVSNPQLCTKPIEITERKKKYLLPFPFKASKRRKENISLVAFAISSKRSRLEICFGIAVEAPDLLVPLSESEYSLCELLKRQDGLTNADASELSVVVKWATIHGVPLEISSSKRFVRQLEVEISDRVEQLLTVDLGELLSNGGDDLVIDIDDHEWGVC